jgi:tryptophanyl-tRNA synthetase
MEEIRNRMVSGIKPTGKLTLGNYIGALKQFITYQDEYEMYIFIANLHALTLPIDAKELRNNTKDLISIYLAAGLDPEKSTIYVQSDLPETAELYLLLNMNTYLGELQRVTSFKDKVRKQPNNVNAGLLTYPTLMAADILIHRAAKVPVGKDQEQHLEMTRTFANRFNNMYGKEVFPLPQAFNFGNELVKIPGLDGSGKMGKSEGEGNAIFLNEDPASIKKKIMRAKTDSGPTQMNQEKPVEIENLFTLMKVVSSPDTVAYFEEKYNNCEIRYGDMKKQLVEDMVAFTTPFRKRITELSNNEDYLIKVMNMGKEKAHESAKKTIDEVRKVLGFRVY